MMQPQGFEENREFLRVDYEAPLDYREVRADKLLNRSEALSRNISACGLLFRIRNVPPALSSVLWVKTDPRIINVCAEIEKDLIIRNGGVYGRVVRLAEGEPGVSYDVGVCFLRRNKMLNSQVEELSDIK